MTRVGLIFTLFFDLSVGEPTPPLSLHKERQVDVENHINERIPMDVSCYLLIDYRHHQVLCTIPKALDRTWVWMDAPLS